jgi:hypothetical protein
MLLADLALIPVFVPAAAVKITLSILTAILSKSSKLPETGKIRGDLLSIVQLKLVCFSTTAYLVLSNCNL